MSVRSFNNKRVGTEDRWGSSSVSMCSTCREEKRGGERREGKGRKGKGKK
jgi:hypothetical protein